MQENLSQTPQNHPKSVKYFFDPISSSKDDNFMKNINLSTSLQLFRTLLHATSATKVPSILTNNLDWRMVSRNKFGQGVSFSHSSMYANKECSKYNGHSRAIIIAKVLVHQSHRGSSMTRLPMSGYDTTTDHRGFVTVKYYDDEFYPEYVAYYTNNSFFDLNSLKSSLDF